MRGDIEEREGGVRKERDERRKRGNSEKRKRWRGVESVSIGGVTGEREKRKRGEI